LPISILVTIFSKQLKTKVMSTITGAMGIPEAFMVQSEKWVEDTLKMQSDGFSDILLELISKVRNDEFGEAELDPSSYEKKLILIGFFTGRIVAQMEAATMIVDLLEAKKVG
jgi:hypothetical protein